ncbi:sulfatase [Pontiellaceae bacterium B12219]|nr:sulfatase [Pontiellaceae bacterium B12219]
MRKILQWKTGWIAVFLIAANITVRADRPNFIFILSDDQSWTGSSALMDPEEPGSKSDYYQTPNMERLFANGMRFTQGYAPGPICCPTRRSLQIGQNTARHIYQKDQPGWTEYYKKQPTIPKALKAIDPEYRAAHFGKWDMRFDNVTPEQLGYDVSDGYTDNGEGGAKNSKMPSASDDPKLIGHVTRRAEEFMRQCEKDDQPFYVQLSHYAVHLKIFYKQETLEKVNQRSVGDVHRDPEFAAMTEDLDDGIGQLMQTVKELGLEKNTYIIFMSDNGGRVSPSKIKAPNQNKPLRDGKHSLYEGGIRVPFTISGPGIQPGTVSRIPVSGVDLLPTITDLAGKKLHHDQLDGGSLKPLLLGESKEVKRNDDFFVFHTAVTREPVSALRMGDYKLVKTWDENKIELFDLSNDLGEKKDLSEKLPEKTEQLHQLLVDYLDGVNATTEKMGSKKKIYKLWDKKK